ncbi:MAG: histidine phosphatase family protein [bacterium]|nr:histidine phosphatase family protein [bacterium]
MKNILLIRHGESESNAGVVTEHPKTVALTELGRKQAQAVADLIHTPPQRIVYSPYARSLQTALPTMEKFPQVPCEEWPIQEFTYLNPKKYYHTTKADRHPMSEQYWEACDPQFQEGEGESFEQFLDRMEATYHRLEEHPERILLFTHGHVIRMLLWFFLSGLPRHRERTMVKYRALRQGIYIPNGAVLGLSLAPERSMSPLLTDHLPLELLSNQDKFPPRQNEGL